MRHHKKFPIAIAASIDSYAEQSEITFANNNHFYSLLYKLYIAYQQRSVSYFLNSNIYYPELYQLDHVVLPLNFLPAYDIMFLCWQLITYLNAFHFILFIYFENLLSTFLISFTTYLPTSVDD